MLRELIDRIDTGATQAELAHATGLSRPTISTIVGDLKPISAAVGETERSTGGRKASVVRLDPGAAWAAAVDIGRSHIHVAACDLRGAGGEILQGEPWTSDSPDADSSIPEEYGATLTRAAKMLDALLDEGGVERSDLAGLAVGLPGPVYEGRPRGRLLREWGHQDVGDAMLEALRTNSPDAWREIDSEALEVVVDNDANLCGVAEHRWGVGQGVDDQLYVKWATGLGAAVIMDGALRRGAGGAAGEFGHTPVRDADDVASCDACGRPCLESKVGFGTLMSGVSFQDIQAAADDDGHSLYDEVCEKVDEAALVLGRELVPLVNALNPALIVIDGILNERNEHLFAGQVMKGLDEGALGAARRDVKIRGSRFTLTAAARGGLAEVIDRHAVEFLIKKARERSNP